LHCAAEEAEKQSSLTAALEPLGLLLIGELASHCANLARSCRAATQVNDEVMSVTGRQRRSIQDRLQATRSTQRRTNLTRTAKQERCAAAPCAKRGECVFRGIVTADFGIVTGHSGAS